MKRVLLVAGAAFIAIPTSVASGAHRSTIAVRPDTVLHMKGSDIVCTVVKAKDGETGVACFHQPGGPNGVRKGYAIVVSDTLAGVEPSGSNSPVVIKRQPSISSVPRIPG